MTMVVGKLRTDLHTERRADRIIGESGLGKSTLINTLFETKLYQPKQIPTPSADRGKTVQIESISAGESLEAQPDGAQAKAIVQISKKMV